jgi:hypothetical protein
MTVAEVLKSMEPDLAPAPPPTEIAEAIKKLRSIQEDYLKVGKNLEAVSTTKLVLGMISEHLTRHGKSRSGTQGRGLAKSVSRRFCEQRKPAGQRDISICLLRQRGPRQPRRMAIGL